MKMKAWLSISVAFLTGCSKPVPVMPADVANPLPTPYPTSQWSMISPEGQAVLDGKVKVPEGHHYLSEYLFSPEARAQLDRASRQSELEVHQRYAEEQKRYDELRNHTPECEALLKKYGFSSNSMVTLEDTQKYDREHQGK
jgi:hypothetical protein